MGSRIKAALSCFCHLGIKAVVLLSVRAHAYWEQDLGFSSQFCFLPKLNQLSESNLGLKTSGPVIEKFTVICSDR